jgi:tRNA-modifying protein YgfZ
MLNPSNGAPRGTPLSHLGVVQVEGVDAIRFLQGQLSNDVAKLVPGSVMLAGLHNPQGRAIALLRLVLAAPERVLAVLPKELVAPVSARLSKFVLRAKVKITDGSDAWIVEAAVTPDDAPLNSVQVVARAESESGAAANPVAIEAWHAREIAAGMPQVYAATSEAFVAQMLNLDTVGGVAFDKGCYTGQEVIARAHYRGKVKRRMQRFRTIGPATFTAGGSGALPDGRTFKVVDALKLPDGRCEFLAVAPLTVGAIDAEEPGAVASTATPVEQLPMSYALPE